MSFDDHPTVVALRARPRPDSARARISAAELKQLALRCGADDAGLVELERPALDDQRALIQQVYGETRTLLSFVVCMNREPVRSTVRSVANQEFHATYDAVNETARDIVRALAALDIPACNSVAAFPMEVQLPGRAWMVAHKPVAVAAGLGRVGLHRNVIHPRFGSFVLLGTVLLGVDADAYDRPIDYNPCLNCNLCVAACPVAAIKSDGAFDFMTCYTHNYREFLGNFSEWVGELANARDAADYRQRVSEGETRSMWQSLSFKPGYKAAYCVSVCPAGEQVIAPFLDDRKAFTERVVRPLRDKAEPLYVLAGSDAEQEAPRRFPNKQLRRVEPTLRASSIQSFLMVLRLGFQRGRARALSARYHFRFRGEPVIDERSESITRGATGPAGGEEDRPRWIDATVHIASQRLSIEAGHVGEPDLSVAVDGAVWLRVVNHELPWRDALAAGTLQVTGPHALLHAFSACFPNLAELA